MTNSLFNPQPNYSGVTIQIANPAVNVGSQYGGNVPSINSGYYGVNSNGQPYYQGNYVNYPQACYLPHGNEKNLSDASAYGTPASANIQQPNMTNPIQSNGYPNSYPAQYYLNNYNYAVNGDGNNVSDSQQKSEEGKKQSDYNKPSNEHNIVDNGEIDSTESNNIGQYRMYSKENKQQNNDMTKSQNIIDDIADREAEIQEEKKNSKETNVVALTDEYIKSLENYLNNPNDEIRLMASKEILTRLDEDKDRYDDAALNALINKMMQDPNKLVRIAALSALNSKLASGNDYTVKLLHNIQSNPNSDKEDILQAADILLKMSAGVEVKQIPNPSVKDKKENKG